MEERCWKKSAKGLLATTNFLEVLVDDEKTTLAELNHVCGKEEHIFSRVRIPKRRLPIIANPTKEQEEVIVEDKQRGANMGSKAIVKFKILFHFIKGKIALTPMETILIILEELEYLEGLVKLARKRKDVEGQKNQVATIHSTPTIKRVSVNKIHRNKTLHLAVEINQAMIQGLVDTGASMLVMATSVVTELGIMHLVAGHETYKTTSGIVTHALRRITELPVKVGRIMCQTIFLVVDTDNYDLLLGLDFLIKIGVVVDVEKGVIRVRDGLRMDVEVLPLNVINMLQVLEGSKEEKCNVQELFNRKMGQSQIKD
jgi:predicted aspartyl protease